MICVKPLGDACVFFCSPPAEFPFAIMIKKSNESDVDRITIFDHSAGDTRDRTKSVEPFTQLCNCGMSHRAERDKG